MKIWSLPSLVVSFALLQLGTRVISAENVELYGVIGDVDVLGRPLTYDDMDRKFRSFGSSLACTFIAS